MPSTGRRYLFTGGGTGGHVTPNLAILEELRRDEPDARFLYVGSARGYESRLSDQGIAFRRISSAAFCSPRRPFRFAWMAFRILLGTLASCWVCLRFRPHVVIASGGYVSVPTVLGAWITRRRIYLHEQNVAPGLANRILAIFATRVGVSFLETRSRFPKDKTVHVGYPVRRQIGLGSKQIARERFRIPADRKVAFVLGGSMGARSINRGTVEALHALLERDDIAVIHSTGLNASDEYRAFDDTRSRLSRAGLAQEIPGRYVCEPFIENIQDVYALADLVIARAGAGTVMELAAVGKPSILIPKSDSPGNHQLLNALSLQDAGSAQVLFEERTEEEGRSITRVRGDALAKSVTDLLQREDSLARMGLLAHQIAVVDALRVNVDLVQSLAGDEPLTRRVVEEDRVGSLVSPSGERHELLFRTNVVSTGLLADISLRGVDAHARFIVLRTRHQGETQFHLLPKRGRLLIGGQEITSRQPLNQGDRISVGSDQFTFAVEQRQVERTVEMGTVGLRVLTTSVGTLISRLFGFCRDALCAAVFGLGNTMDIMAAGLTISNYFRGVFAEMAVDNAFLPTYIHLQRTGRAGAANRLFSSVLTLTVVATAAVSFAAILTLPLWLSYLVPGFATRGILDDAIGLTRIMFPYLVLISIAAVLSAVLKACNRFAVPAYSSVMFSVGVMVGVALYPVLGLEALGYGVLLGGLGQVLVHLPALRSQDLRRAYGVAFAPQIDLKDPGVRKVGRVTPNIFADVSIQRFGDVVDKILATPLAAGMVSALYFALIIFRLPFGLISQSLNTVILKELSESQATQDKDATRRLLAGGLNWTFFTLLPVSLIMVVLADPITDLLLGFGAMGAAEIDAVATGLRWYSVGLVGWGVTALAGRFLSARMEQGRATLTSLFALIINVLISWTLVEHGWGIGGLALGTSISFLAAGALRVYLLVRELRREGVHLRSSDVFPNLFHTGLATLGSGLAALVTWMAVADFQGLPGFLNRLFILGVPLGFGAIAFFAIAFLLGSEQLDEVLARVGRKKGSKGSASSGPRLVNPYCIDPPAALLTWVQRNRNVRDTYDFTRRTETFLSSRDWRVRNVGIKLVGELGLESFQVDLTKIITCRVKARRLQRFLGGDFLEPGFLRRNALIALQQLGVVGADIERTLLTAVTDPYFEARVEAVRALGKLGDGLGGAAREEALVLLQRTLTDKNFEVVMTAVESLGRLALDDLVLEPLRTLHYHKNWQVRDKVVQAYKALLERRVVTDRERMLALLDDVLTTSEGFVPRFLLKEHMAELHARLLAPATPGRNHSQATGTERQGDIVPPEESAGAGA